MKRFCPRCGATEKEKEKEFIQSFCADCFIHDHPGLVKLPASIEVKQCPGCDSIWFKGSWVPGTRENIHKLVQSRLKTTLEKPGLKLEELSDGVCEATVTGTFDDLPITITREIRLKYNGSRQCLVCARRQSTYHEALIQLRFKKHDPIEPKRLITAVEFVKESAHAMSKKQRTAGILKTEQKKEGIDVFIGSQQVARHVMSYLINTYSPEVKESWTLVGLDKSTGKRRYRVTYSVRL
jgi:NMD protein affecting ribosome stability and mRNA decay